MKNIILTLILSLLVQNKIFTTYAANVYEKDLDFTHYSLYKDQKVTWIEAFVKCQADGAQLLYIDTLSELEVIIQFLLNSGFPNIKSEILWTSGSDAYHEGNFIWMSNGKPFPNGIWGQNSPSNSDGGEHCVTLCGERNTFVLNDDTCSKKKYYVCKSVIKRELMSVTTNSLENRKHNEADQTNAEPQLLKTDVENERFNFNGDILGVLIVMTIAILIMTIISVKEEISKILKTRKGETTNRHRLEERDDIYQQSL